MLVVVPSPVMDSKHTTRMSAGKRLPTPERKMGAVGGLNGYKSYKRYFVPLQSVAISGYGNDSKQNGPFPSQALHVDAVARASSIATDAPHLDSVRPREACRSGGLKQSRRF